MVTASLAAVAGLVLLGLAVIVRRSRTHASIPFPLAAFPLAGLLMIAPATIVSMQALVSFRNMGVPGQAGIGSAAVVAMAMVRPVWIGCFGFLLVLGGAMVIEWFDLLDAEPVVTQPTAALAWPAWVAGLAPLVALPAASLVLLSKETAAKLMLASAASSPENAHALTGMSLHQFSQVMAARLLLGVVGGGLLMMIGLFTAVAGVAAHRLGSPSAALRRVSGIVAWIAGSIAIWLLFALALEMRSIARAAGG